MCALKTVVKINGLGIHRDMTGFGSGVAYEDIAVFLGSDEFSISDGSKIYAIVVDCLHEQPTIMSDEINMYDPLTTFGSAELSVQTGTGNGIYDVSEYTSTYRHRYIGSLINEFLNSGKVDPLGYFRTDVASELDVASWSQHVGTSGPIVFHKRGWQASPDVGDTIFWGREALLVSEGGSITPGTYSGWPDANYYVYAVKRAFGTAHERHGSSLESDDNIELFIKNPIKYGREVEIYDYDTETGDLIWRFSGYMEKPNNDDNQHITKISCRGQTGSPNDQTVGKHAAFFAPITDITSGDVGGFQKQARFRRLRGIWQPSQASFTNHVVCKIGDAIVPCAFRESLVRGDGKVEYKITSAYGGIMGTRAPTNTNSPNPSDNRSAAQEILVGHQFWTHFKFDNGGGGYDYSTHPFDVVRALLISNRGDRDNYYDVLPHGWGLGIPYEKFNHTEIDFLKNGYYGGLSWVFPNLRMTALVIGADTAETYWDVVTRILKPLLCVLTDDENGLLTIRPTFDLGPEYVEFAFTEDDIKMERISYESTRPDPVQLVKYNICRRGTGTNYSGDLRSTDLRGRIERSYGGLAIDEEVSALDYGDPSSIPDDWQSVPELVSLLAIAQTREDMINSGAHYYRVVLSGCMDTVGVARLVELDHPVAFGNDGERGFSGRRMLTLGHNRYPSDAAAGEVELTVVDIEAMGAAQNLVAPAWIILENTRTGAFGNYNIIEIDTSEYDETDWEAGQEVTFLTRNGTALDGGSTHTVTDASGSIRRISPGFSSAIPAGSIMCLALYHNADSESQETYAWFSDSTDATFANGDEGHKWSF